MLNELELTGRARTHVSQVHEPRFAAQPAVVDAFFAMREDAKRDGIQMHPFSSFRDFGMQVRIWNKKFRGEKPLYDMAGVPRDYSSLGLDERIWAILSWSALPGGSRHHWGTEIDVVDLAAVRDVSEVRLLPFEVAPGGPFRPLYEWLSENMHRFDFFRPYAHFQGGMYSEPWHLSFAPLSVPALGAISLDMLSEAISQAPIDGRERTLELLPEIFARHVTNVNRFVRS